MLTHMARRNAEKIGALEDAQVTLVEELAALRAELAALKVEREEERRALAAATAAAARARVKSASPTRRKSASPPTRAPEVAMDISPWSVPQLREAFEFAAQGVRLPSGSVREPWHRAFDALAAAQKKGVMDYLAVLPPRGRTSRTPAAN